MRFRFVAGRRAAHVVRRKTSGMTEQTGPGRNRVQAGGLSLHRTVYTQVWRGLCT